jgi:murein DD-endopeptidase MepM/ murein hydrolase activator NlpD
MTGQEQSLRPASWTDRPLPRLIVAMAVLTLVAALGALDPSSASANDLGSRIGSARRGQTYYESTMLRADRVVAKLDRHAGQVKREMRRADRKLKKARSHRADARQARHLRESRLELLQDRAPADGEYVPKGFEERLHRAESRFAHAQKVERRADAQMAHISRTYNAKHRKLKEIRRAMRPAIRQREAAESGLAYLITSGTRLAQQRAALKTVATLGPAGTFVWPTPGGVTQHYGCTGFYANPPRGSCRHFHDGLDISPSGGTRIGTVATGVVAYAGWNPWDEEGRAFIVVIGHADGYVSRYGHLVPNRRIAVAGQVVYRGQTIGTMGSTGNSTGVHLHVEILRNGSTVDPMSLLPDRGHDGKAKNDKKKGHDKAKGKSKHGKADKTKAKHARTKHHRGERHRDRGKDERAPDAGADATNLPTIEQTPAMGGAPQPCDTTDTGSEAADVDGTLTLSDLADRLERATQDCERSVPDSEVDPTWVDGDSPWDPAALDAPRLATGS